MGQRSGPGNDPKISIGSKIQAPQTYRFHAVRNSDGLDAMGSVKSTSLFGARALAHVECDKNSWTLLRVYL